MPFQRRSSLLGLAGLPPEAEFAEALHARDAGGTWFRGGGAAIRIAAEVPLLRPLSWAAAAPGMPRVVDVGYRLIARNRQALSRLLGEQACRLPSRASGDAASQDGRSPRER